jgi:hypothetical protein
MAGLLGGIKSALRGGPKPSASRIAELQARGFNTDLPLFRGTGFDIGKEIDANRALHVTDAPYYASAYAHGIDSPFSYRPNTEQYPLAEMSRKEHKNLQRRLGRQYTKAVEKNRSLPDGDEAPYRQASKLRGELRQVERDEFRARPLPPSYHQENLKRGLPVSRIELFDMAPSDEASERAGSNLTWDHVREISRQMEQSRDDVTQRLRDEVARLEGLPEYLEKQAAYEAEMTAWPKYRNSLGGQLSDTPHVAPMYTSAKNPYPMVQEEGIMGLHESPETVRRLMSKGYDSAIWTPEAETENEVFEYFGNLANNIHGGEMVVFRPKDHLTGAFADFVPLLKKYGLPITGAGVATLASMLNQRQPEMA